MCASHVRDLNLSLSSMGSSGTGHDLGLAIVDLPSSPLMSPSSAASEDTALTLPSNPTGGGASSETEEDLLHKTYVQLQDIRFTSYRTAAKLRCLQKQSYLHHVDIWNLIEAFRENGLQLQADLSSSSSSSPAASALRPQGAAANNSISQERLHALLVTVYENLSKRLPPTTSSGGNSQSGLGAGGIGNASSGACGADEAPSILKAKSRLLFRFLLKALSPGNSQGQGGTFLKVRTVKTVLATLCTGKLMDKFRYIFTQLSDPHGHLVQSRFSQYLQDISRIPVAVGEDAVSRKIMHEVIFDPNQRKINLNDFLETMMSDPGPHCLSWLLILHRVINTEGLFHGVSCSSCGLDGFYGLRYKSDVAGINYQLCQDCFWRGRIHDTHADDVFKEFTSFRSSSASGKSSIKKGLHCLSSMGGGGGRSVASYQGSSGGVGGCISNTFRSGKHSGNVASSSHSHAQQGRTMDYPEKTINLSNMIPHSDAALHHPSSMPTAGHEQMQPGVGSDEHNLIAQYASAIAFQQAPPHANAHGALDEPEQQNCNPLHQSSSKKLLRDLERKNREIMNDISQLKKSYHRRPKRPSGGAAAPFGGEPDGTELTQLRSHRGALEERLVELQETRRDLMTELDELMKLLQTSQKQPMHGNMNMFCENGGEEEAYLGMEQQNCHRTGNGPV